MLNMGDKVLIKETGKKGEIVDVSETLPRSYAVEWEEGTSFDWGSFGESDLEKIADVKTA